MNNIKKTPNTSENGYYSIIISAVYEDEGGNEYDRTTYNELSPTEFADALPELRNLLTNLIGYAVFRTYAENITPQQQTSFYKLTNAIGIDYKFPSRIRSTDDVKIIYTAPDGTSYKVNLT